MRKQRLKGVTKLSQNHRDRKLQNWPSGRCILVPRPIGWGWGGGRGRNTAPTESQVGSLEPAELQNRTQEAQVCGWRVSYTQGKDRGQTWQSGWAVWGLWVRKKHLHLLQREVHHRIRVSRNHQLRLCHESLSSFQPAPLVLSTSSRKPPPWGPKGLPLPQRPSPGCTLSATHCTNTTSSPPLPFVSFYSLVPYSLVPGLLPWWSPTN